MPRRYAFQICNMRLLYRCLVRIVISLSSENGVFDGPLDSLIFLSPGHFASLKIFS